MLRDTLVDPYTHLCIITFNRFGTICNWDLGRVH